MTAGRAEKQWMKEPWTSNERQHKDLLLRRERSETLDRGLSSFPQLVSGHPSLLCVLNRLWPQKPKEEKQPQAATGKFATSNSLSFYPHRQPLCPFCSTFWVKGCTRGVTEPACCVMFCLSRTQTKTGKPKTGRKLCGADSWSAI